MWILYLNDRLLFFIFKFLSINYVNACSITAYMYVNENYVNIYMYKSVVCFAVSTVFREGFFTSSSSAIYLDDLSCTGFETNLFHCPYDYRVTDCTHAKDAGVRCYDRGKYYITMIDDTYCRIYKV